MTDAKEREICATLVEKARQSRPEDDDKIHPCVAACVVKDGVVLGYAARGETGKGDHAEYGLLEKKLGSEVLAGSTVYTTLEPCTTRNHPKVPCAKRLAEHKVARVVIGMLDPNPDVLGKGVQLLRDANIEVAFFPGEYEAQIEALNRNFIRSFNNTASLPPLELDTQRLALADKVTRYLPSRIYPATTKPSRDFNDDLMQDLRASNTYVFRGGTGRYVPLRLGQLHNLPTRISIGLINPADSRVVTQRALDRISQRGLHTSELNNSYREIMEQIEMCVVALFDFRHACEVAISFGENTSAFRYEIFDAAAYVSTYHSSETTYRFPETVRFEKGSVFYRSFRLDCERHFRLCPTSFMFDSTCSDVKLAEALASLGFDSDAAHISQVSRAYERFVKEFRERTS